MWYVFFIYLILGIVLVILGLFYCLTELFRCVARKIDMRRKRQRYLQNLERLRQSFQMEHTIL